MAPSANYALSGVRKAQFFIAGLSLPCAIASMIDKHASAETVIQFVWVIPDPYHQSCTERSQLTLAK